MGLTDFSSEPLKRKKNKMVKANLADKPKRPMSAYFLWMNGEGRQDVKKKNPSASITEVSKACGETWGNIDGPTKTKWEKKAEEAKKNFDKEYKAWLANGGEELLQEEKNAKKKGRAKGKAAPKRAAPKKSCQRKEESGDFGRGGAGAI